MTAWTDARIPIAVAPLPGEALESWIGAYARRLRITGTEFLSLVGLPGSRTRPMALRLLADEAAALERSTGVPLPTLVSMTLEPYDGFAVSFLPGQRRLSRPVAWRFSGSRNRYCPACLAEQDGRGPVFWRLPWAFACLQHQCLLLDFCPACHRFPNHWKARRLGPSGTSSCTLNSSRGKTGPKQPCGYRLDEASVLRLPGDGLVLAAQRHIADLLSKDRADRPPALAEFKQLYALAWRVLRGLHTVADRAPEVVRTVVAECGGALPELTEDDVGHDAHNAAVGTALARVALHPGHRDHEALFEWILHADRSLLKRHRTTLGARADRWTWSGPELVGRVLSKLDHDATLHARLRYGSASPHPRWPTLSADAIERRASTIPAMLWPGWAMRLLPRPKNTTDPHAGTFRRGCSSFLLLPGGPPQLNFERAGPLLGNHQIDADRDSIERRLYRDRDLSPLASALAQLAYALDEHGTPINYARRRAAFTNSSITLDVNAYARLCAQHGWSRGRHHRVALLRWHLLMLLTGHAHPPPNGVAARFAWHCTDFRFRAPQALRAFLREQAQANLAAHQINEPVTWEPPDSWVTDVTWPGIAPASIPTEGFRDLLDTAGSVHEAADALGLASEHIRLYCDLTDISATTPSDVIGRHASNRTVKTAQIRQGILAPDQLRDLYENHRREITHIAQMASCSANTVRRLLQHDGVPLRPRPNAAPDRPDVTREWLHQEYVVKERDMANLARAVGLSHYYLTKLARSWGLPIRGPGSRYNAIGHLDLPQNLSPAIRAVTTCSAALPRLRTIVQIPGYTSFSAAARDIYNGRDSALRQRVIAIEREAGFQIIDRHAMPLAPTPRGHEFLTEAREILRIADRGRTES